MKKGTRILMTSAKGGVGTGFVTVNTALALCRLGLRVLLVDAGPFCRSHDTILSCAEDVVYDLGDLAKARVSSEKTLLCPLPDIELYLLPGVFDPSTLPSSEELLALLVILADEGNFDCILVDAPALPDTVKGAAYYDMCCVIADPTPAALRAAEAAGNSLTQAGANTRLIINRFSLQRPKESGQDKAIHMVDAAHLWLLGLIPIVGELGERPKELYPLLTHAYRHEPARIAFDNLAARLTGTDIPLLDGIRAVRARRTELLY